MNTIEELKTLHNHGYKIQFKNSNGNWHDDPSPSWRRPEENYRLKPDLDILNDPEAMIAIDTLRKSGYSWESIKNVWEKNL